MKEKIVKVEVSKETFWDEVKEKYPEAFKVFSEWIDEYKEVNKWTELFNFGHPHYSKMGWHCPKFHDIPFSMQFGIFYDFMNWTKLFNNQNVYLDLRHCPENFKISVMSVMERVQKYETEGKELKLVLIESEKSDRLEDREAFLNSFENKVGMPIMDFIKTAGLASVDYRFYDVEDDEAVYIYNGFRLYQNAYDQLWELYRIVKKTHEQEA